MSRVVVVGGSVAAAKTVQGLRERGHDGPIVLVSDEPHPPYDRPPLSKEYLATADAASLELLPAQWYADHDVELLLGTSATGVDLQARRLETSAGSIPYDDLVIATGARARTLPGADAVTGVHTLRSRGDADALREQLAPGAEVVVIGAGFIGFEVASTVLGLGARVTVVEAAPAPLGRSLDPATAAVLVDHARAAGAVVRTGVAISELSTTDGRVDAVLLADGTRLPADVVVVGIGATPTVGWLEDSGLPVGPHGLSAEMTGAVAPGVWAVGDVAGWSSPEGEGRRHEHWTSASDQARVVAQNIVAQNTPDPTDPTDTPDAAAAPADTTQARTTSGPDYVWSDQFGLRINIIGEPLLADTLVRVDDTPATLTVLYAARGRLVGACIAHQPRLMAQARVWVARDTPVDQIPLWVEQQNSQDPSRSYA
ncbi:FAD-dependent oxidoreductase [Nocardioides sp.]|uniref:NAD(P)/FAD-dependent oxidoreductase n=1 Tax=Nocardioides sp. TaxID=35761 RepID=UPI00260C3A96|nr:FAD-dependent oxidoreductase [Nocardioides sp.]